jgi:hypothetical protein
LSTKAARSSHVVKGGSPGRIRTSDQAVNSRINLRLHETRRNVSLVIFAPKSIFKPSASLFDGSWRFKLFLVLWYLSGTFRA